MKGSYLYQFAGTLCGNLTTKSLIIILTSILQISLYIFGQNWSVWQSQQTKFIHVLIRVICNMQKHLIAFQVLFLRNCILSVLMSHFLEKVYIFSIWHIVPITKKGGQASILKVKGGVFASCCYKIIGITLMLLRPIFANQSFLSSHLNDFKNWIHPFSYYAI